MKDNLIYPKSYPIFVSIFIIWTNLNLFCLLKIDMTFKKGRRWYLPVKKSRKPLTQQTRLRFSRHLKICWLPSLSLIDLESVFRKQKCKSFIP